MIACIRRYPTYARDGWDAVHPQGTLDAALKLDAVLNGADSTATPPPVDFLLTLTPRDLAITPAPLPYRLDLKGGGHLFAHAGACRSSYG